MPIRRLRPLLFVLALVAAASPPSAAAAQPAAPRLETSAETLAEDAGRYVLQHPVSLTEAERRLRAQQDSVAVTDRIAREFAGRLAGFSIEHEPEYRIVVLLTGSDPVPDRAAGGVPIVFRTGARTTHDQAIAALRRHLVDLRAELPGARGAGYDQRTGEIVLLVSQADAELRGLEAIRERAEEVAHVPVRAELDSLPERNMSVDGGGPVGGVVNGRRVRCTSGFVVTDGSRTGIATAAHCPDDLTYRDADGSEVPLPFAGQWGVGYQDVQINLSDRAREPLFYADRKTGSLRELTSWRNAGSTRAGDFVCHWGESSGYSCAEVQLTDYAPPGELCGGPCEPAWVTVKGPSCIPGDSGGPVFSGRVAFGIAKGMNRTPSGRCDFYYYMSTDFLPAPWRLAYAGNGVISQTSARTPAASAARSGR